jgi:hypothetical protein
MLQLVPEIYLPHDNIQEEINEIHTMIRNFENVEIKTRMIGNLSGILKVF